MRVLYGGSVKPGNAAELLGVANVDGALVGGELRPLAHGVADVLRERDCGEEHPRHDGEQSGQRALRGVGLRTEQLPMILGCDAAGYDEDGNEVVVHAIVNDPLTAAVLAPAEIKQMVNEMFAQNKAYLPQFKHTVVA